MKLLKTILACGMLLCSAAYAERTVLSVDTNNVVNRQTVYIPGASVVTLVSGTNVIGGRVFDGTRWTTIDDGFSKIFELPVYLFDVTNYPGYNSSNTDRLATEWFVGRRVDDVKAALSVFGEKGLYAAYTNSPPTDIASTLNYLSNCVYILSNVKVQTSFNDVTNEINDLSTRLTSVETKSNRFGGGVDELDYIINSNIDNLDAEDMLNMMKVLAKYIKNGTTNTVTAGE